MSDEPSPEPPAEAASDLVIEATSREDGKYSTVRVFPDRIEWIKERSISSLPRAKSDPPVIPLHTVRSVKARKDGPLFSKVILQAAGDTIVFRMHSPQAVEVRDAIAALVAAGPPVGRVAASAAPPAPPTPDTAGDDLRQLQLLRDEGFLSPEEFEAAKAQLGTT
jgi:hypothetical protein